MIPKALLRAIRLRAGDEVRFSVAGGAIRVEHALAADALMGRLAGHKLVDAVEAERRAERLSAAPAQRDIPGMLTRNATRRR